MYRSFDIGFNEYHAMYISKSMMNDFDESLVSTVYDIFDYESKGKMDVSHLYIVYLLVCAMESRQLLHYMHQYGRALFELMCSKSKILIYDRYTTMIYRMISICSLIFDKSCVELQRLLQRVGVDVGGSISFEDFEVFLYDTISTDMKSKDQDVRLYYYEYDMDNDTVRHFEVKKQRVDKLHTQQLTGMSSLRCTLI